MPAVRARKNRGNPAVGPVHGRHGGARDRLADLYATHLVEVTLLIHSSLDRKAQQFADAFKWRKDT
jgi:hypothetical protein